MCESQWRSLRTTRRRPTPTKRPDQAPRGRRPRALRSGPPPTRDSWRRDRRRRSSHARLQRSSNRPQLIEQMLAVVLLLGGRRAINRQRLEGGTALVKPAAEGCDYFLAHGTDGRV